MESITQRKLIEYASTLPEGSDRSRCYAISEYGLCGDSIAEALLRENRSMDGILKDSKLMLEAGCATENGRSGHAYGSFTFEDGSTL